MFSVKPNMSQHSWGQCIRIVHRANANEYQVSCLMDGCEQILHMNVTCFHTCVPPLRKKMLKIYLLAYFHSIPGCLRYHDLLFHTTDTKQLNKDSPMLLFAITSDYTTSIGDKR